MASQAEEMSPLTQGSPVSTEELLRQLECIATFDPRRLFGADGASLSVTELDPDTAAAIAAIDVEAIFEGRLSERKKVGELRKWRPESKRGAIETLLKQRGEPKERTLDVSGLTDEEVLELERLQLKASGSGGDPG